MFETTSVRGFEIIKYYADAGVEVTFLTADLSFFRNDLGFEDISYATRVLEIPGLATATDLSNELAGRIGTTPVTGIICRVEDFLEVAGALAREWGLPHENPSALTLLADKDAVRQRLAEHGLGTVVWRGVRSFAEASRAVADVGLPLVLKPAFGGYSLGVHVATTLDEAELLLHSIYSSDDEFGPKYLIEEYVAGVHVSVELIVQHGDPFVYGCTQQREQPHTLTAETGRHFPADFLGRQAAEDFAVAAIAAVGLHNSAIHMELIMRAGVPELVEINGRVVGHVVTQLISRALGRSVFDDLLNLALGRPLSPLGTIQRHVCLRHLWVDRAGVVSRICVPTSSFSDLLTYELTVGEGSSVLPLKSNWERFGYVIAEARSAETAVALAEQAALAILESVLIEPIQASTHGSAA